MMRVMMMGVSPDIVNTSNVLSLRSGLFHCTMSCISGGEKRPSTATRPPVERRKKTKRNYDEYYDWGESRQYKDKWSGLNRVFSTFTVLLISAFSDGEELQITTPPVKGRKKTATNRGRNDDGTIYCLQKILLQKYKWCLLSNHKSLGVGDWLDYVLVIGSLLKDYGSLLKCYYYGVLCDYLVVFRWLLKCT